nr:hypothetical protein [Tanacetum cinerariifolium]
MKGYKLPPSYYIIKKIFKTIGLGYESIHAYVNDCFLFRGDNNKDVHLYLVCKTSRWRDSNTPGKKVPKKVLRYVLIIPRLQRLYKSSRTAREMTWHATRKCTKPSKMQHPVDGRAWKNFETKYPNFAKEPRNVRLGLAADGFNSFGNLSQAYNILAWKNFETKYPNFAKEPRNVRLGLAADCFNSFGNLSKDFDVYLRPLIEDIKVLWALKCVVTIDVATGQKFNMRAMQYLPDEVAKPIIELCSLFKQICSVTLMEDDMLKARKALEGGPIRPWWMFPFERFMKKGRFDVIHFDNSPDLPPSTSLNDLDNTTLHIDGQSMEVDAVPNIIDLDEDDDIIDDEDAFPHDLAKCDDDGVDVVYSSEEED